MAAVSRTPSNSSFYPDEEEISRNSSSSRLFLSWNFRGFYSSCHARKVILTRGFNLLRFLMRFETFRQIITSAIHLWFFLRLRKNIFLIRGWTRNTYDLSFTVSLLKSLGRLLAYAIRQIVIIILIHDSSFPRCNVKKPVPFVFLLNIFFNINYVTCYITKGGFNKGSNKSCSRAVALVVVANDRGKNGCCVINLR